MSTPDDLITWLRQQIDTDAERPYEVHDLTCELTMTAGFGGPCTCGWARRILAEIDAKRRRIEHYLQVCQHADPAKYPAQEYVLAKGAVERSLMFDALPFADREGYREEWRP